jgi:hypothetical protein
VEGLPLVRNKNGFSIVTEEKTTLAQRQVGN